MHANHSKASTHALNLYNRELLEHLQQALDLPENATKLVLCHIELRRLGFDQAAHAITQEMEALKKGAE